MSQNRNQFKLKDSLYRHQKKKPRYNQSKKKMSKKRETIFLCEMQEKLYIDGSTLKPQKEKLCNIS